MNIIERIASHNFVATDLEVQQLAQQVVAGRNADSTYLKVLVVAVQAEKSKRRAPLPLFEAVAERLYKAVIVGVSDADTPKFEVNRRATFARTSASALRKWIVAGGDVKTLDPLTVTKRSLAPVKPKFSGDRVARAIQAHTTALIDAAKKLEARDPLRAATMLTDLIEQFQAELDQLEEEHAEPAAAQIMSTRQLERVRHRPAERAHA